LIVVSHDRYLVERVADTVLAVPGDGTVLHRPGGVDQYLDDRRAALRRLAEQEKSTSMTPRSGTSAAGDAGPSELGSGELRQLKKDLQRLDKRMESLRRKQATLHDKLAAAGADYAAAATFNAELKDVGMELEATELEWLDTAEKLES
jgi:ATP-binding cassette subfamily F protein uup